MRLLAKLWQVFWITTAIVFGLTAFIAGLVAHPVHEAARPFWPIFVSMFSVMGLIAFFIIMALTSQDVANWFESKAK